MAPTSGNPPVMKLLSKSTLGTAVSNGLIAFNPSIDLIASAGEENALHVWRADDELVSKQVERNQRVATLRWKEDGHVLAAGWSDGVVRLIGLENTKAVHQIRVADKGSSSQIQFVAWTRNRADVHAAAKRAKMIGDKMLPARLDLGDKDGHVLDLPHELTFLEIDTALPKLSPLPVSGGSGDDMFVFSTRSSLDFVFRSFKAEDTDTVDVMMAGTSDGGIHLTIFDSFTVGTFRPTKIVGSPRLVGHGANPALSTHALLLAPEQGEGESVYVVPMDLTFVHSSPVSLCLLASKTTTLHNLLRYIKQTQCHMMNEWKASKELPARLLASVQEDLSKRSKGPTNIVQALYHTVVTGHVYAEVKQWLVDSVAERGHKRWEKAVAGGLGSLRSLVHRNLMPALERCAIILSRLLGLARFHESGSASIGFTAPQITQLMDIVSCLTLVCHKILLLVMDELETFEVFAGWLRFEMDRFVSPSMAEELTEREALLDYGTVLKYVRRYLTTDPLGVYFDELPAKERDEDAYKFQAKAKAESGEALSRLELLDQQLKQQERGAPYLKALPNLDFLIDSLVSRANTVFRGISEAEARGVRLGKETELRIGGKVWKHDVRVCSRVEGDSAGENATKMSTFTALASKSKKNIINIFRTDNTVINGTSGNPSTSACSIHIRDDAVDFEFLNDTELLVLCHHHSDTTTTTTTAGKEAQKTPLILRVPFQATMIPYQKYAATMDRDEGVSQQVIEFSDADYARVMAPIELSSSDAFTPVQMEVHDQARRRQGDTPARVCLLGADGVSCRVYALPERGDDGALRSGAVGKRGAIGKVSGLMD